MPQYLMQTTKTTTTTGYTVIEMGDPAGTRTLNLDGQPHVWTAPASSQSSRALGEVTPGFDVLAFMDQSNGREQQTGLRPCEAVRRRPMAQYEIMDSPGARLSGVIVLTLEAYSAHAGDAGELSRRLCGFRQLDDLQVRVVGHGPETGPDQSLYLHLSGDAARLKATLAAAVPKDTQAALDGSNGADAARPHPDGEYAPGELVFIEYRGHWYPGEIQLREGTNYYHVRAPSTGMDARIGVGPESLRSRSF